MIGAGRWGRAVLIEFESGTDALEFFQDIGDVLYNQSDKEKGWGRRALNAMRWRAVRR
jgi:hypothetical protein